MNSTGIYVYQGVELLLLVPMLFLLTIPKCLLIFKENFYYTSIYSMVEVHCRYILHNYTISVFVSMFVITFLYHFCFWTKYDLILMEYHLGGAQKGFVYKNIHCC